MPSSVDVIIDIDPADNPAPKHAVANNSPTIDPPSKSIPIRKININNDTTSGASAFDDKKLPALTSRVPISGDDVLKQCNNVWEDKFPDLVEAIKASSKDAPAPHLRPLPLPKLRPSMKN